MIDDTARHNEKMAKKKAARDKIMATKQGEKGLIVVHTGKGKGKSSSAFGMIFRCIAWDMPCAVVQFIKGGMESGEKKLITERFSDICPFYAMGEGFTWETQDRARDIEMAQAKSGNWWEASTQRALSNNSVAYSRKPGMEQFIAEWKSLYDSKSGERGIYNVAAAQAQAAKFGRRDPEIHYGTNPCSEIILRPYQFCNLSEVVVRENDTKKDIQRKVELATILGTWQSTLTDFKYLRKI